jgi:hypothetical protein
MTPLIRIPLCEYEDSCGPVRLIAVLDEVTLTYAVVGSDRHGDGRPLCRHLPSLREAREWACAYRDRRAACGEACSV